METQLLEIELRDGSGNVCLTSSGDTAWIQNFQDRIEEKIGGMLCLDHMYVPASKPDYINRRWVIKVACCCMNQSKKVEDRLNHYFKR